MVISQLNSFLESSGRFFLRNGIWYSISSSSLSYPEDGNNDCFELEDKSFWFQHRNNCLVSAIKKYSGDQLFFDVGGGNGFVAKALEQALIPSVLIEPGKQGAVNAKKRLLNNIICGTLNDLDGLAGQIDAIGAFDVIEHLKDDIKFVKDVHDMLQKGGTFFVTVPAFQFLWSDEDTDAGHFRRYNKHRIKNLLADNGFEIVYSTYFFSVLILPLFFIRTLPSKFGIRNKSKKKTQKEHNSRQGIIGKVLESIWKWELLRINKQQPIPFGTSCLIIAIKKNANSI